MPALRVFGRAFHIASDDVPLFALGGAIFHLFWIIAIAITARNILDMPDVCKGDAGLYYIATVASLLLCFASGFILELLLIWQGCQGAFCAPSEGHHRCYLDAEPSPAHCCVIEQANPVMCCRVCF